VYDRIARLLHRIKSAAMVIPLDPVTQITHTVETLIAPARADRSRWPQQELEGYLRWLHNVAEPEGTVDDALAADPQ
jgi:chemotaxis protein histidine kinase CheA